MKVVLKEDVEKLGKKGDIKDVSNGYARNFLMPRNLVEVATLQAIKNTEKLKKQREKDEQARIKELEKMADGINGIKIKISEKAKDDGTLFGSVKSDNIIDELNKKTKAEFTKDMIILDQPIKKVGEYSIKIKISRDQEVSINLIIKEEK